MRYSDEGSGIALKACSHLEILINELEQHEEGINLLIEELRQFYRIANQEKYDKISEVISTGNIMKSLIEVSRETKKKYNNMLDDLSEIYLTLTN